MKWRCSVITAAAQRREGIEDEVRLQLVDILSRGTARMIFRVSGLAGMAAIVASQAGAQTAATQSDVEVFEPAYFARFNPATAEDMVRQLPARTAITPLEAAVVIRVIRSRSGRTVAHSTQ